MAKLTYPKKPWTDGQRAMLIPGLQFIYSLSLKKWVPVTPGASTENQIEEAFGVKTAEEVERIFIDVEQIKNDVIEYGRIWKTEVRPAASLVANNDVWIDQITAKMFFWNETFQTWIEINSNPKLN